MYNRMVSQNKFSSEEIYAKTGKWHENPIVIVGNKMARQHLEKLVSHRTSCVLIGPVNCGRMTAVREICSRHKIPLHVLFNEVVRGLPEGTLIVTRTTKVKPTGYPTVYIVDADTYVRCNLPKIVFSAITAEDRLEYKRLKGESMIQLVDDNIPTKSAIQLTAESLTDRINYEDMPYSMDRLLAYNFRTYTSVVNICAKANVITDPFFKWMYLNLIKYKYPIILKYPPRFKDENS